MQDGDGSQNCCVAVLQEPICEFAYFTLISRTQFGGAMDKIHANPRHSELSLLESRSPQLLRPSGGIDAMQALIGRRVQ